MKNTPLPLLTLIFSLLIVPTTYAASGENVVVEDMMAVTKYRTVEYVVSEPYTATRTVSYVVKEPYVVTEQVKVTRYRDVARMVEEEYEAYRDVMVPQQYTAYRNEEVEEEYTAYRDEVAQEKYTAYRDVDVKEKYTAYRSVTVREPYTQELFGTTVTRYRYVTKKVPYTAYRTVTKKQPYAAYRTVTKRVPYTAMRTVTKRVPYTATRMVVEKRPYTATRAVREVFKEPYAVMESIEVTKYREVTKTRAEEYTAYRDVKKTKKEPYVVYEPKLSSIEDSKVDIEEQEEKEVKDREKEAGDVDGNDIRFTKTAEDAWWIGDVDGESEVVYKVTPEIGGATLTNRMIISNPTLTQPITVSVPDNDNELPGSGTRDVASVSFPDSPCAPGVLDVGGTGCICNEDGSFWTCPRTTSDKPAKTLGNIEDLLNEAGATNLGIENNADIKATSSDANGQTKQLSKAVVAQIQEQVASDWQKASEDVSKMTKSELKARLALLKEKRGESALIPGKLNKWTLDLPGEFTVVASEESSESNELIENTSEEDFDYENLSEEIEDEIDSITQAGNDSQTIEEREAAILDAYALVWDMIEAAGYLQLSQLNAEYQNNPAVIDATEIYNGLLEPLQLTYELAIQQADDIMWETRDNIVDENENLLETENELHSEIVQPLADWWSLQIFLWNHEECTLPGSQNDSELEECENEEVYYQLLEFDWSLNSSEYHTPMAEENERHEAVVESLVQAQHEALMDVVAEHEIAEDEAEEIFLSELEPIENSLNQTIGEIRDEYEAAVDAVYEEASRLADAAREVRDVALAALEEN